MNLFKTTLLVTIVTGLACSSISANPQDSGPDNDGTMYPAEELSDVKVPVRVEYNAFGNIIVAYLSAGGASCTLNMLYDVLKNTEVALTSGNCTLTANCLSRLATVFYGIPLSITLGIITYKLGACAATKILTAAEQIGADYWYE